MTFEYRDADGARLRVEATHANTDNTTTVPMVCLHTENPHDDDLSMVFIPLDRIEEVVAGIRDAARTTAGDAEMAASLRRDGFGEDEIVDIMQRPIARTAARQTTGQDDTEPAYYGVNGCTCRAWTRVGGTPRFLRGDESVELIGGWEEQPDCPHHAPAVGQPAEAHDTEARPPRVQWRVEGYDADVWLPVSRSFVSSADAHARKRVSKRYPDMPTRVVRETTTWTVEDER